MHIAGEIFYPGHRTAAASILTKQNRYLNIVHSTPRVPTAAELTQLASLRTVAETALETWWGAQDAAYLRWEQMKDRGMISSTISFTQWVVAGYPAFLRSLDELKTADNRYQLYKQTVEGGSNDGWSDHKADLIVATNGIVGGIPGFSPGSVSPA
jgi:hypothetical protein